MDLSRFSGPVYVNAPVDELMRKAVGNGHGILTNDKVLSITTGKYTGRSPRDRYIVDEDTSSGNINWGKVNVRISEEKFEALHRYITDYLMSLKELYVFEGTVGADYPMGILVVNELASHALFSRHIFRMKTQDYRPELTILCAPGCRADGFGINSEAFIVINFKRNIILIGGTGYCGEIKKSVFTFMNYILPEKDVLPMHCSANLGKTTALFFGLSGTGKTTLSADPNRRLIGDDEHGWSENGIFNFEGGCYAKCINLSKESEPDIFDAIRHGALVENVVVKEGQLDFDDQSITENTRATYPLTHIHNALLDGRGSHPKTIIFLTADAFGVMPPISKLDENQALYHFLSGYTSKLAGTERGITEPVATFSTLFGEPFMPRPAIVYAELLKIYIRSHNTNVFLVNTGWTSGPYGTGHRIPLRHTRKMISAALDGKLDNALCKRHPIFNLSMITSCPEVPEEMLDPRRTWDSKEEYDRKAKELAGLFAENFKRFENVPSEVIEAGPNAL